MSPTMQTQKAGWTGTYPRRVAVYAGATLAASAVGVSLVSLAIGEVIGLVLVTLVSMAPAIAMAAIIAGGSRLIGVIGGVFFASTFLAWLSYAVSSNSTGALALVMVPMLAFVVALAAVVVDRLARRPATHPA